MAESGVGRRQPTVGRDVEEDNKILDRHIGGKIRERRKALRLTQEDLAKLLGLSHQQVQRYESGDNTVSVSRLLEIARGMNVGVDYFYANAPVSGKIGRKQDDPDILKKYSGALKILLVEDAPSDELLFRKAVEKSGIPATITSIQKSEIVTSYLLECRNKQPGSLPHILVIDINMPKLNGLELLKQIKRYPELGSIPALVLTNSVRSKDMLDAYANHASGFIQKNPDLYVFYKDIDVMLQYWTQVMIMPAAAAS